MGSGSLPWECVRQCWMDCREQNIRLRRRMGVLVAGVCLRRMSGEMALAPHLGILSRSLHRVNGKWGPMGPAIRSTLGAALLVSRQPRNRMGLGSLARQHARYQFQWNVHRVGQSFVDWRGVYSPFGFGPVRQSRLFGEAHRARAGHGRGRDAFRWTARATLSRSPGFSLPHRFLSSSYTMLRAARIAWRLLRCGERYSPASSSTPFEVA
jgi:hypothetical protein